MAVRLADSGRRHRGLKLQTYFQGLWMVQNQKGRPFSGSTPPTLGGLLLLLVAGFWQKLEPSKGVHGRDVRIGLGPLLV